MTAENIKNQSLKIECIRTITKTLGVLSTTDISLFTREQVQHMGKYLLTERSNIHKIFRLRDRNMNPKNSVRDNLDLLRKILKSWHGGTIKPSNKTNYFIFSLFSSPPPYKINVDNDEKIVRHLEPSLLRAINENATNETTNCRHEKIEIPQKSPQIKIS